MPKLLRFSEKAGCGATIELDNSEVVYVSIAQIGVLARKLDMNRGIIKGLFSNFFGPKLYNESSVYKNAQTALTLSIMYPEQAPSLRFENPVLAAFSNAIWHCASAAEVCTILNGAAALKQDADMAALQRAFNAAKNWQPKRPPEMTTATYQVVYSDGMTQNTRLIPTEIENWVSKSNKANADKPYRIVRVLDPQGQVVFDVP